MNSRQRKVLLWFAAAAALLLLFPPHAYGPRGVGHRFIFSGGQEGTLVAALPLMGMLMGLAAVFGALFFAMAGPERVAQPGVRTAFQKVSGGTIRLAHGAALAIAVTAVFSLIRTGLQYDALELAQVAPTSTGSAEPVQGGAFDDLIPADKKPEVVNWSDFTPVAPQAASGASHEGPVQQPEQKPWEREWRGGAPVAAQQDGGTNSGTRLSDQEGLGGQPHKIYRGTKPMVWFVVSLFTVPITVAIRVLNKRVIPAGWRSEALFNAKRWWDL